MPRTLKHPSLRGVLALVGAIAWMLGACGSGTPSLPLEEQTLVVSNWEAYMPDVLPTSFEAATGVETMVTFHMSNEEIFGAITSGESIDVAFVAGYVAEALDGQGLLAEIDHELIPNLSGLYPEGAELGYDPGNEFSVPYTWGTTGLCYRSDLIGHTPSSWYDLLTPVAELEGKVTMIRAERWLLMPAQKALGYSLNTTDPREMEDVRGLLQAAKQHVLAYDDSTFYQRLVSGEAVLSEAWDGRCNYGIAEDPGVRFVVPDEGADLWTDAMVIPEASPNKEAAHAFINHVLSPDNHRWVVENLLYKTPNQAAMESVDPALFQIFPTLAIAPDELFQHEALRHPGEAAALYTQIATEVVAGG